MCDDSSVLNKDVNKIASIVIGLLICGAFLFSFIETRTFMLLGLAYVIFLQTFSSIKKILLEKRQLKIYQTANAVIGLLICVAFLFSFIDDRTFILLISSLIIIHFCIIFDVVKVYSDNKFARYSSFFLVTFFFLMLLARLFFEGYGADLALKINEIRGIGPEIVSDTDPGK